MIFIVFFEYLAFVSPSMTGKFDGNIICSYKILVGHQSEKQILFCAYPGIIVQSTTLMQNYVNRLTLPLATLTLYCL